MTKSSITNNQDSIFGCHRLAVIGGGPGGISFCMQLFTKLKHVVLNNTLEVLIFEKTYKVGPGLAYSGSEDTQIINHPKDNMEPIADASGQFTEWLGEKYQGDYPPRHVYGKYMEHLAKELQLEADNHPSISLNYVLGTCITNIETSQSKFLIHSKTQMWEVDYVVLSTGHLPTDSYREFIGQPGYAADEYSTKLNFATLKGDEDIGIIGSRLTAVDIALKLQASGHQGRLIMASRNGVLPAVFSPLDVRFKSNPRRQYRVKYLGKGDKLVVCTTPMNHVSKDDKNHQTFITAICLDHKQKKSFNKSKTVLGVSLYSLSSFDFTCKPVLDNLIHQFMSEIEKLQGSKCHINQVQHYFRSVQPLDWLNDQIKGAERGVRPWQLVLFALNPRLANLWSGLSLDDKWDFSRKYKSMFMTYYAAIPLQSAYKIRDMVKAGQLIVMRDVQPVKYEDGVYSLSNGKGLNFQTKYFFNAMGPGCSVVNVPLYADLIANELVTPHTFGGINVDEDTLQVVNKAGNVVKGMFAIGELTKGHFLIAANLPKIAVQANKVAETIAKEINARKIVKLCL